MDVNLGVVFDLDDTLYLERDYVRSGFTAVASFVASRDAELATTIATYLWESFEAGVRGRNFDILLEHWPMVGQQTSVDDLVAVYRHHEPTISLIPQAKELLGTLSSTGVPLGLISDGPVASQRAKLRALGVEHLFDVVIITGKWGTRYHKPHNRPFREMEDGLNGCSQLVYVADNPAKDFVTPRQRGWTTIRIRVGGQLHREREPTEPSAAPEFDTADFGAIVGLLRRIRNAALGDRTDD